MNDKLKQLQTFLTPPEYMERILKLAEASLRLLRHQNGTFFYAVEDNRGVLDVFDFEHHSYQCSYRHMGNAYTHGYRECAAFIAEYEGTTVLGVRYEDAPTIMVVENEEGVTVDVLHAMDGFSLVDGQELRDYGYTVIAEPPLNEGCY